MAHKAHYFPPNPTPWGPLVRIVRSISGLPRVRLLYKTKGVQDVKGSTIWIEPSALKWSSVTFTLRRWFLLESCASA